MGDMNVDLLKNNPLGQKLISGFQEYCYTQLVTESTHHTKTSHSLIDHIYTNTTDFISQSGVLTSGISNHDIIYIVHKKQFQSFNTKTIRSRNFKQFDNEAFSQDILSFPWENIYAFNDKIDDQVTFFESSLSTILNCHAPLITKTIRAKPSAWLNQDLKKQMRLRDQIKRQHNISKCPILYKKYQSLRNQINIACRKQKQKHFHNLFNKSNDSKDLWLAYKQLTASQHKSTTITEILYNDTLTKCPTQISQAIASSVIIKPENITLDTGQTTQTDTPPPNGTEPISPYEVSKCIRKMKPKKSSGLSDLPTKIIKQFPD
jgi:hypothetical protein